MLCLICPICSKFHIMLSIRRLNVQWPNNERYDNNVTPPCLSTAHHLWIIPKPHSLGVVLVTIIQPDPVPLNLDPDFDHNQKTPKPHNKTHPNPCAISESCCYDTDETSTLNWIPMHKLNFYFTLLHFLYLLFLLLVFFISSSIIIVIIMLSSIIVVVNIIA